MYWWLILTLGTCVCCLVSAAPSNTTLQENNEKRKIEENPHSPLEIEEVKFENNDEKIAQDPKLPTDPCSTVLNNSCTTANQIKIKENYANDSEIYTINKETFNISKTTKPERHKHDPEINGNRNTLKKLENYILQKQENGSEYNNINEIKNSKHPVLKSEYPMKKEGREGTIEPSSLKPEQPSAPPQISVEQPTSTQAPNSLAEAVTESVSTTKKPVILVTTNKPKPSKPKPTIPKPVRASTAKPLVEESPITSPVTVKPSVTTIKPPKPTTSPRYPCRCASGTCSCCTGIILENFNVPLRSRACANVTYEPDDFAFNFKLAYNNIVLYNRRMSAKNPRPACIPINRYFGIKMCAKLSNVYMSGRNVHACLDFEGTFDDETAFNYSFNCFRIGSSGVAIVRPEDGGGLPPPPVEEEETDEDYDDSARGWVGNVEIVPN